MESEFVVEGGSLSPKIRFSGLLAPRTLPRGRAALEETQYDRTMRPISEPGIFAAT